MKYIRSQARQGSYLRRPFPYTLDISVRRLHLLREPFTTHCLHIIVFEMAPQKKEQAADVRLRKDAKGETRGNDRDDTPAQHSESETAEPNVSTRSKAKDTTDDSNKSGDAQSSRSKKKTHSIAKDCVGYWDDPEHVERCQKEFREFQEKNRSQKASEQEQADEATSGQKRGRGANAAHSNKKQKHDEPHGSAGDKTRVPKQGQKVQWHALPGYVDGEVLEVAYEDKTVQGKKIKASKEDPRIVLKSVSGKVCVHKPEVVFFD